MQALLNLVTSLRLLLPCREDSQPVHLFQDLTLRLLPHPGPAARRRATSRHVGSCFQIYFLTSYIGGTNFLKPL